MEGAARLLRLLAPAADAGPMVRRRVGRAARRHRAHAAPRRHPAARPRLPGRRRSRRGRRLPARRRRPAAAAAARRRRGGGDRRRAPGRDHHRGRGRRGRGDRRAVQTRRSAAGPAARTRRRRAGRHGADARGPTAPGRRRRPGHPRARLPPHRRAAVRLPGQPGVASARWVEPLRVVHTGRRWYLVARDRDRDAWRTFRVDRVTAPVLTGQRYTFVDPPDPVALVSEGTTVAPYPGGPGCWCSRRPTRCERCARPRWRWWSRTATTRWCAWPPGKMGSLVDFVLRLPFDLEVLDPPELRAAG